MSIKGYKSQQALQQKLGGYTEDQSIDRLRYATIQEMSGKRHALDVIVQGAYQITTTPKTIEAGSNIRTIKITNHGASKDDIIRLSNGTQFSALSIPDANTIITSVELDASPVADTCTIWRHITPSYNADGSLNVLASQGPVQFNKDGVNTTVNYVTGTPTNSDALPVNIVTVNGQGIATTVDLSGAQINVQLTDRGTSPDAIKIGDGTTYAGVTVSNEIKTSDSGLLTAVNANGVVSAGNSSIVPLLANAVFTGSSVEIKDYASISVAAISDVASATNGLSMQFSPDGVNWDHSHNYTSTAVVGLSYTQACELRYFRIVYTNGATDQAYFRLTVILKRNNVSPSRYTFDQGITGTQLADNTKSVIHGVTTGMGGGYVPVKVSPSGALTVEASLSAGSNNIGDVDVASIAAGTNLIGKFSIDQVTANANEVVVKTINSGTNTIGKIDLNAGTNLIGKVSIDQVTANANEVVVKSITAGSNLIGKFSIDQVTANANEVVVKSISSGTNTIGKIDLNAGTNNIGKVTLDQSVETSVTTKGKALTNEYAEFLTLTTVQTFTAPTDAIGGKIMAQDTNSANIRYKQNGTATTTSGMQLQPGRAEDFTGGSNITVVSESGTNAVFIQWTKQP